MAKRLTDKQKKEILKGFKQGKNVNFLSETFNCNKLTIIRNLKKSLGEDKYKECLSKSSYLEENLIAEEDILKEDLTVAPDNTCLRNDSKKVVEIKENLIENDFNPVSSFLEIPPLTYEIDNAPQKDLSSVPICEIDFPKIVYMIVDKNIELETKYLKDYPAWDFLSKDELDRKTIEIHNDLKIAKRLCRKDQKVIKVPNTNVFKIVAPILLSRGISRIISADNLIAL